MELPPDRTREILASIEPEEVKTLALELGNIASPTGYECEVGEFLLDWLSDRDLNPLRVEAAAGRYAVAGAIPGQGGGTGLLFNSHMDTWIGAEEDRWILGREVDPIFNTAWMEDDLVVGAGVVNDKGPMAATMLAVKAVKDSGVRLPGDIILTMVPGEIGQAPVDEYQGDQYWGKGLGARRLVEHGIMTDYALVAEATDFGLTRTQCGAAYIKVSLKTDWPLYTPYVDNTVELKDHKNAVVRAAELIRVVQQWAVKYEEENQRPYPDGTVVPKVNIGAIRGGLPTKPSATPCICALYVDVRVPPHRDIVDVKDEFGQYLKAAGLPVEIEMYLSRRGYEGRDVDVLAEAIEQTYESLSGERMVPVPTPYTSMWRDMNVFNEVGVPAVTFGPPRVGPKGRYGFRVESLRLCAQCYASVAMKIAGREK